MLASVTELPTRVGNRLHWFQSAPAIAGERDKADTPRPFNVTSFNPRPPLLASVTAS